MKKQLMTCWLGAIAGLSLLGPSAALARGPEGGSVWSIAISPSDPQIMYVGTSGGGVFRSTDGGETWEARDREFPTRTSFSATVFWISIHPEDPNTVVFLSFQDKSEKSDGIFLGHRLNQIHRHTMAIPFQSILSRLF